MLKKISTSKLAVAIIVVHIPNLSKNERNKIGQRSQGRMVDDAGFTKSKLHMLIGSLDLQYDLNSKLRA